MVLTLFLSLFVFFLFTIYNESMLREGKDKPISPLSGRIIVPVLGVNLDSSSRDSLLTRACRELRKRSVKTSVFKPFFMITPNPEIVYRASNEEDYRKVLNKADLSVVDGVGLAWAMWLVSGKTQVVVPGRVLVLEMVKYCAKHKLKVFLLGGAPGVAEKASLSLISSLQPLNSNVQFDQGPWLDMNGEPKTNKDKDLENRVIEKINKYKPALLVVCFGPPKQEYWINKNLGKLRVNVVVGAGGTLDYLSGKYPLPPKVLQNSGFEWVWRLFTQPYRLPRILTAIVLFPLKVLASRFL